MGKVDMSAATEGRSLQLDMAHVKNYITAYNFQERDHLLEWVKDNKAQYTKKQLLAVATNGPVGEKVKKIENEGLARQRRKHHGYGLPRRGHHSVVSPFLPRKCPS